MVEGCICYSIYNVEFILCNFGGSVVQGRYEFPFEFTLPPGIPGKQGTTIGSSYYIVDYHLEARLSRREVRTCDVQNSIEVLMTDAPYNRFPTPVFLTPSSAPVYFLCCIRSGTMTLGAKIDSNNVCSNESVRISYEVRNDSTSRIKAVEVRIHEVITFSAEGKHATTGSILFKQRIDASQLENVMPDRHSPGAVSAEESQELINKLVKSAHFVNAFIPATARPSFKGSLGSVYHFVDVQIMTPFCVEDPEITYPMIIHRTGVNFVGVTPVIAQPFTLPPNWYAVNAQSVNLDPPPVRHQGAPTDYSSVEFLCYQLENSSSYSEASCLKEWVTHGRMDQISPANLARIFSLIKAEYSFTEFPNVLGASMVQPGGMSFLTCRHIKDAAAVSPPQQKQTVCTAFARYCGDKHNARAEFSALNLPPYNLSAVLVYY
mmetsp:Transcript_9898/g.13549  ORF Transcript_9898/g.13549 Transcript_9898/m.13549 type:complete len:433 (-) Transcript_9898:956-2254(-)